MRCRPPAIFLAALLAAPLPLLAGDLVVDGKLVSTTTSGPPLEVSSSDVVTNLNADMVDGLHASELAQKLGNVVYVAKSGGDFTTPFDAMAAITDASASNPYLVFIAPGIYQSSTTLKPYVHVAGSGEGATVLTTSNGFSNTVNMASFSSLRDLTVRHEAPTGFTFSRGIALASDLNVEISRVTVSTVGGVTNGTNDHAAIRIVSSNAILTDVTVSAAAAAGENGIGIEIEDSTVVLTNPMVDVSGSGGGLYGLWVKNASSVDGNGGLVSVDSAASGGTARGVYATGNTTDGTPGVRLTGTELLVSGAVTSKYGVYSTGAAVHLAGNRIFVNGGGDGLHHLGGVGKNTFTSARGISLRVVGGASQTAISNSNSAGGTVQVFDSQLVAGSFMVATAGNWTTDLVRSHLDGGGNTGGGTVRCRYSTDENLDVFTSSCP